MPIPEATEAPPPRFSEAEARALAWEHYQIKGTARPLPSERDQNFLLETEAGPEFVLKIANAAEPREILEAQNAALEHLARQVPALQVPRVRATTTRQMMVEVRGPHDAAHLVRLLTYLPGHLLADVGPHSPELLESLGALFGRVDRALGEFTHSALQRTLKWDLRHADAVVTQHLPAVEDEGRRALVERMRERFRGQVMPALGSLPRSLIHNDGNDYNVLVTGIQSRGGQVSGLLDFGDLVETCTIFELAICTAYAILDKPDPIVAAAAVVGGYHRERPLTEQELDLLYDLVAMRLCTSVTIAAVNRRRDPGNAYLTVSEQPAWAALERLAAICPRLFTYACRQACGLVPCPRTQAVVQWLEAHAESIGPVVEPDARKEDAVVFDLSPGSPDFAGLGDPTDATRWTEALFQRMQASGARVGIGRYDEARKGYSSEAYRPAGSEVEDWRTVHLGMDLFLPPGSPVLAPLDASVHSVANHSRPWDYGPTVVLRHALPDGGEFFTLYGHLSVESLKGLSPGMAVPRGRRIGTIGEPSVNGGWPPHLHLQLIVDLLDRTGTFPGVCAARDRALWRSLSPDPNLLLRLPRFPAPRQTRTPEAILEARSRHLGANLFVSYTRPVVLVEGWGSYLYDHLGREYLDATNNVAHVGHAHPAVVRAATEQMRLVNTNTRYLHEALVEYAERLCATLPAPLRVCYFVCSGSEANELALRLARTHTRGTDVLVVEGAYHGNTGALIDVSPYKFDGPGGRGAPPHVHTVPMPDIFRGSYRDPGDAGRLYAQHVRAAVEGVKRGGRRVAAFLCEPMLSCAGQIVPPPGYLEHAYGFVRNAGGVCIADEVQVGFGRVGSHYWGFETQGVVPDIVTMGKPMGNGHPIGAVVTTPEIAAAFASGGMEYFNTFGGNPVSCAVGLAVLDVIERERLQAHAATVGTYCKERLRALMPSHPLIGDVRGEGLFLGVEFVRDRASLEPAGPETAYVADRLRELGVLIGTDGPFRNVLKIKPPMVFTRADVDRFVGALERILREPRLRLLRCPQ